MANESSALSERPTTPSLDVETDNEEESLLPDDDFSYTSDDFYGRNVVDCPPSEIEDSEWYSYLHESDRREIEKGQKISPEDWTDRFISDVGEDCELVLDAAKKEAWENCHSEVAHIMSRLRKLLKCEDENKKISLTEIIDLALGEKSEFYLAFSNAMEMNRLEFAQFFGTLCLQMSYKETPACLFDRDSLLHDDVLIEKVDYMKVWEKMATGKRINSRNFVGTSRREKCLWEILEVAVNKFLRTISIVDRNDEIEVSYDDDKIWCQTSGKNEEDHFGLRRVTHVKDNRRGIISHTAVSTTTLMPLGFLFERKGNNAISCFNESFSQMFPSNEFGGLPDLNGVMLHSDRGYTLESTVFQLMIPAGANFTNTVKRIEPFPFLWGMKPRRGETRTILKDSGCPALYIKEIIDKGRKVSCFAFRTGTSNICAVISSSLDGHQWEGVCLSHKQRKCWEADNIHGLDDLIFTPLAMHPGLFSQFQIASKNLFDDLRESKVDVLTLEQGTADWHKARQFSFTSSQADGSFRKALIIFQDNSNWCNVAAYLEGNDYHTRKYFYFTSHFFFE